METKDLNISSLLETDKMELLRLLNPWWKEGRISTELAPSYRRLVFPKVKELFQVRPITILTGLRRVGKSTLLYQLIEELLAAGQSPDRLLYFSFDEKIDSLWEILKGYQELTGVDWKTEKCFLFLDEIQKLPDWSNKVKLVYDQFPQLKIVLTGSGSFQVEKEAKINLAGRHFMLYITPLQFEEYLRLKGSAINHSKPELWKEEIQTEFQRYLYRPFPEIVEYEDLGLIKSYIKDNIIEKILKVDLLKRFTHINEVLLSTLVDIIYNRPGIYLNYDELSGELKVSKKSLFRHFYYLQFAYIIRIIHNYRPNVRTSSRKLQRAYPFHWSLGFGWTGTVNQEALVASILNAHYYWREQQKEVDFLIVGKEILPIEVKESVRADKSDLYSLIFFMKKYKIRSGMVVYNGVEEKVKYDEREIIKVPVWKMALNAKSGDE